MFSGLAGDVRFGFRVLGRQRLPSLVMILTLALAVGANTALFSVVHQVLLSPLPFQDEDRIHFLWHGPGSSSVSPRNYMDWKEGSRLFELAAFDSFAMTLTQTSSPQRLNALRTSHDFLNVLGVEPVLGRFFTREEDGPGSPPVAVLSHQLWRSEFGSDPDVLGTPIHLNGVARLIIGILPEDFEFLGETRESRYQAIVPIAFSSLQLEESQRGAQWIGVVGRLVPEATLSQARQELDAVVARLRTQTDRIPEEFEVSVVSAREEMVGDVETILWALLGSVVVVLLVAILNVAGLMLARSTIRRGEFAVRAALGATSLRLARQTVIESLLISGLAGLLGLALSFFAKDALVALAPADIPRLDDPSLNSSVLFFCLLATTVSGFVLGLAPALASGKRNLTDALSDLHRSARGSLGSSRTATTLVMLEIMLAFVVLSTAGVLGRSLLNLESVQSGFETENAVRFRVSLPSANYDQDERVDAFYRELLGRLRQLPESEQAGAVMHLPLGSDGDVSSTFSIENQPENEEDPLARLRPVTPEYFAAMRIPILEGREFRSGDTQSSNGVMVVNRQFAELYFPEQSAIGKRVRPHVGLATRGRWATIVGVVGDVHHRSLDVVPSPEMYIPHSQSPVPTMSVVVRTRVSPSSILPSVRSVVRDMDPELPVFDLATLSDVRAASLSQARFQALLFGGFAAVALFLACVGIFGLISYQISTRISEIGVRRALGAGHGQILVLIVGRALTLTLGGLVAGWLGSLVTGRFVDSLLFEVRPNDPVTLGILALCILAASLFAILQPALRALRIAPLTALRGDSPEG